MDRHVKRLEESYKQYPVHISEELFREGFALGKKLGLLTTETFEEVFPRELYAHLEKTTAYYFSEWPEQLYGYLKPYRLKYDDAVAAYVTAEIKIVNLKQMVIGERISTLAKQKNLAKKMSFGRAEHLIEDLKDLLPDIGLEVIKYELPQTLSQDALVTPQPRFPRWPVDDTRVAISQFKIREREISMHVQWNYPYRVLDKINECLEQINFPKRIVQFEEIDSGWGLSYSIMLINKDALDLEDNPYIPFYSKNNLWVIDKEEVTPEIRKRVEKIAEEGLDVSKLFTIMNRN